MCAIRTLLGIRTQVRHLLLYLICLILIMLISTTVGSASYAEELPLPVSVSLPTEIHVGMNRTITIVPELEPSIAGTSYSWKTDDSSIAIVQRAGIGMSGNVTGISEGETNIYVTTENGLTASCHVVVSYAPTPKEMSIPETHIMKRGDQWDVPISLVPSNAKDRYSISTDNFDVLRVNTTGSNNGVRVYAKKPGIATIMVTSYSGLYASCLITVEDAPQPETITIPDSHVMYEGTSWNVPITLEPAGVGTTFSISCTDFNVTRVATTGGNNGCRVYAGIGGDSVITIRTENGLEASCHITVLHEWQAMVDTSQALITLRCKNCSSSIELHGSITPRGITYLSEEVFECADFNCFLISENVTEVANLAFHNCKSLLYIFIPYSLKSIANNAFDGCQDSLTLVIYNNSYAETFATANHLNYILVEDEQ